MEEFQAFLKQAGRSPSAVKRCLRMVHEFEQYLHLHHAGVPADEAGPDELAAYVSWIERDPKASTKTHLWALRYYYQYTSNEDMEYLASALRQERISRKPFALKDFRGVDPECVERLSAVGIRDVKQMLQAGRIPGDRQDLARSAGVSVDAILELVKLSDLARIPGVKSIRARLYYDAGVDTMEKMARWDPTELREMLIGFVEQTGFDGIAPLPKEAASSVATARRLPKLVEYE
jgi:hypothetical protein